MILRPLLLAAALALPAAAQAASYADLAAIDRDVALFAGSGAAMPVDRRLRLNPCFTPLALSWRLPRRDSVIVQCPDAGGWRLFVPLLALPDEAAPATPAVLRGEAVTITVEGDGFAVSQPGEAMEAGPVGAWIRVRTLSGGKPGGDPIRARIDRPGLVSVPLP
ncbi:MAG: flagella basal body P-ring formation protein FlgA [Sphingomonadales bacterium]|nr:flagella basal body P-ring formation protein FlgA [Sphingomonadales bacterium]